MSKTEENALKRNDSEWSWRNILKRVSIYLLCLFFFALGFLLLNERAWQVWIIVPIIWLLCLWYIVVDVRLLRLKRRAQNEEQGVLRMVRIENGELMCEFPDEPATRIALKDVKLIGECREPGGFIGKWYPVLLKSEEEGIVLSLLHDDSQKAMNDLRIYFDCDMQLRLRDAGKWKSRIVWPPEIVDSPIWLDARPKSILTLLDKIQKVKPEQLKFSPQAISVLRVRQE